MESEQKAVSNVADGPEARKQWHPPVLHKLPIAATASSPAKTGSANCDSAAGCQKQPDAAGQIS